MHNETGQYHRRRTGPLVCSVLGLGVSLYVRVSRQLGLPKASKLTLAPSGSRAGIRVHRFALKRQSLPKRRSDMRPCAAVVPAFFVEQNQVSKKRVRRAKGPNLRAVLLFNGADSHYCFHYDAR
jgi:hypothetical protein